MFFGPNIYGLFSVGYIYSPDAKFKFIQDKDTPVAL